MEIQENCKIDIQFEFEREEKSKARAKTQKNILKKATQCMRKVTFQALCGHLGEC